MNRYFSYDNMELWDPKYWGERSLPINNLAQWIGQIDPLVETEYALPDGMDEDLHEDVSGFLGYLPPEEAAYWEEKGYNIELHHIWVAKWISLVPKCAVRNSGVVFPTVLSLHQEHIQTSWPAKTMRKYRKLAEEAVKKQMILLITVTDGRDVTSQYANIIMEAVSLYPIDYRNIFLDVSAVYTSGHTLAQVDGGVKADSRGNTLKDPDSTVLHLGSFQILDVSAICKGCGSPNQGQLVGVEGQTGGNAAYDADRFVHTLAAKRLAEPLTLEYRYSSDKDPELLHYWEKMGLHYETHDFNHERYVTMTPMSVYDDPQNKIPILLIFQEVYYYNDHLPIEAAAYWFEYCKIAAQGECMLLFYACENYEHNKNMYNVFLDACKQYPVDQSRVYVTGYSHNGGTAVRFAYDYPNVITAIAGGLPGMGGPGTTPEMQKKINEQQSKIDMPCIQVIGCCEHTAPVREPTFENCGFPSSRMKMNALIAGNCPEKTEDDFRAAFRSSDKATRMLGLPNDKNEVLYLEGLEHYIADVKNKNGKYHLRFASIENAPHNPFPTKQILEWSFVRRFARDPDTHEIIELY